MNTFTSPTPLPPLPLPPADERRPLPVPSPVADVFSNTTTRPKTRKPLPPGPVLQHTEQIEDRSTVPVKKPRALPNIPVSPSSTKRRSMSLSDADDKVTASPTAVTADAITGDHRRKENAARSEDSSLHGLLDVLKGELSTLDPVSPASLDLRDPSTPARQLSYRSQTDGLVLSHEIQGGGERDEGARSPSLTSSPAAVSRRAEPEAAPVALIPPRSSSLQPSVYSLGPGSHATSSRQVNFTLTPLRARTGPSVAGTTSSGNHLRAMHRSTASSSEPSLIPTPDEDRVCEQHIIFILYSFSLNV